MASFLCLAFQIQYSRMLLFLDRLQIFCEQLYFRLFCNIPVSIGRLLVTCLAVQAFGQMVSTSAS